MPEANPLDTYHEKRDFGCTPEPPGDADGVHPEPKKADAQPADRPRFVIHRHEARRLHYDLRLEVDGVLKSWAAPKGVPTDPKEKRLAVRTEDHPLEYLMFEGVIPKGEYGAGTVEVWDMGPYRNLKQEDGHPVAMDQAIDQGHVMVYLEGRRIQGGYHLVRTHYGKGNSWLLMRMKEDLPPQPPPRQGLRPDVSGQGSAQAPRRWKGEKASPLRAGQSHGRLWGEGPEVGSISPMLATLAERPFSDDSWIFERKLDGERCLAFRRGDELRLISRTRKPLNRSYPELVDALLDQPVDDFIADGEIVAFDGGLTSFARLQRRMHVDDPDPALVRQVPVFYYLFDLLYVNGHDLRRLTLRDRKSLLKSAFVFDPPLRLMPYRNAAGDAFFRAACQKGWEGVIAKRADSPYEGTRSRNWLKFKCIQEQEFVIGGYTLPQGSRTGFGALLVGYYRDGELVYAGKVGTGFDDSVLKDLSAELAARRQDASPFVGPAIRMKGVRWVRPELVARIGFARWTEDGKLREPRFRGLRRDKDPRDVVREGMAS
jgi:DNA ligase D-like protein (predicted ligase)/DNA ligase D-like protein (predicted 3'-phosphoesterase)